MVQIYFLKKDFDVQKTQRWFAERKLPCQMLDLKQAKMGARVLEAVMQKVGLDAMIDKESRAYKESTARYLQDKEAILSALADNPAMLRLPIIRNGKALACVGYQPDVFEAWERQSGIR